VDERLEPVTDVFPVERCDRLPGEGEVLVGQAGVGMIFPVLVVSDDPDPVAAGRFAARGGRLQRRGDAALGFLVETLRVRARLVALGPFPPQPRRRSLPTSATRWAAPTT